MRNILNIFFGLLVSLALINCGSKTDSKNAVYDGNALAGQKGISNDKPDKGACRLAGETEATSLDLHLENIKNALSGPELSDYMISCGSFVGADRYYQDMMTPVSHKILKEIREIKKFKALAYRTLISTETLNPIYVNLIEVNGNWRNDNKIGSFLVRLLASKDYEIRMAAAGALKGTKSAFVVANLVKMTKSPNPSIRLASVTALEYTEDPAGRAALRVLRNDPDPGVRVQAEIGMM